MGINQSFITEWDNQPKAILPPIERNLTKQIAIETISQMYDHNIPSLEDFCWACKEAAKLLRQHPNCVEVVVQPKDRIIFVGDLHGCFETMIRLFKGDEQFQITPLGYPGDIVEDMRNVYLFNGDLVDRGGSGYQIVYTLCLLLITVPGCVYVNRGNHESEMFGMSTQPGMGNKFLFEILEKFPQVDQLKYKQQVTDLFTSFPICHVFDKNIFVVHAGVPMANDMSTIPQIAPSPFAAQRQAPTINYGSQITPYPIQNLINLQPSRFQTLDFEDSPRAKNLLWHAFLWSYDRFPYAATFLEYNNFKTMVCSHTATPYHFVTTFLPVEGVSERYAIYSVANSEEKFLTANRFFDEHPNLQKLKLNVMEIFSSPTNQGEIFAAVVCAKPGQVGSRLEFDPLKWQYKNLGRADAFKFIPPPQQQ